MRDQRKYILNVGGNLRDRPIYVVLCLGLV